MKTDYASSPRLGEGMAADSRVGRPVEARDSFLRDLTAALEETQQQSSEVTGRLRNNADSLLGAIPEPGNNGPENKRLDVPGRMHQLLDQVRHINLTLSEARRQLDRLDAL